MITFIEWVKAVELMQEVTSRYMAEGRRSMGADFDSLASMAVQAIQATVERDKKSYSPAVLQAVKQLEDSPELAPDHLGGKIRGKLKGIGGNDQEEIVQNAIFKMIVKLPKILGKFADADHVDPDDLGSYLAANLHNQVSWRKGDHYRQSSGMPTMTDVSGGEDGRAPEATYGDDGDRRRSYELDADERPGLKLNHNVWDNGRRALDTALERLRKEDGGRKKSSPQLQGRIAALTLADKIMEALPQEMWNQMDQGGTEESVYAKLKSMVTDSEADMDDDVRELLRPWSQVKGYQEYMPRYYIAAAIWAGNGYAEDEKPEVLRTKSADKVLKDDHWFYDYAGVWDDDEQPAREPEAEQPTRRPEPPVQRPEPEPEPEPEPVRPEPVRRPEPVAPPARAEIPKPKKSIQRSLFDDE